MLFLRALPRFVIGVGVSVVQVRHVVMRVGERCMRVRMGMHQRVSICVEMIVVPVVVAMGMLVG